MSMDKSLKKAGGLARSRNVLTRPERLAQMPGAMPRLNALPAGCAFAPRCPSAMARCATERPSLRGSGERGVACWLETPP